jgi:hypothetical protein
MYPAILLSPEYVVKANCYREPPPPTRKEGRKVLPVECPMSTSLPSAVASLRKYSTQRPSSSTSLPSDLFLAFTRDSYEE